MDARRRRRARARQITGGARCRWFCSGRWYAQSDDVSKASATKTQGVSEVAGLLTCVCIHSATHGADAVVYSVARPSPKQGIPAVLRKGRESAVQSTTDGYSDALQDRSSVYRGGGGGGWHRRRYVFS